MIQHVKAIYEGGILRPLEPLDLEEQAVVSLLIDAKSRGGDRSEGIRSDSAPEDRTLFDVFDEAGLIGCVHGAPADLSTNPRHMEGFGGRAQ